MVMAIMVITYHHYRHDDDDVDHLHLQLHLRQTGGPGCSVCAMNSYTRYGAASDHEKDDHDDDVDNDHNIYDDDVDDAVGGNSGT